MGKNQNATRRQEAELLAAVVRQFPYGHIPAERAQHLIEHQDELGDLLADKVLFEPTCLERTKTETPIKKEKGAAKPLPLIPPSVIIYQRVYELINFVEGWFYEIGEVRKCAKELDANLGKDDEDHIMAFQSWIPCILKGFVFVFPASPCPKGEIRYIYYYGGDDPQSWWRTGSSKAVGDHCLLLRRIA